MSLEKARSTSAVHLLFEQVLFFLGGVNGVSGVKYSESQGNLVNISNLGS